MKHSFAAKIISIAVLASSCVCEAFSLPKTKTYTPDSSGEYVYYRDNTFNRESIVGFVYYNEETYGARYYAPYDSKTQSVEKDISIFFNIDSANQKLDFTGENIYGSDGSQDDADIINYLHDLFLDFAERRQKQILDTTEVIKVQSDYAQFGGMVTVFYNNLIPIFNVEKVVTSDGTAVFEVETIGALADSQDQSFILYTGKQGLPKDNSRTFKKSKSSSKKQEAIFATENVTQKLELDGQWEKSMDNMWIMGDSALVTLSEIPCPEVFKNTPEQFKEVMIRKLLEGTTLSYSLWKQHSVTEKDGTITLMNVYYQPQNGDVTRDFKVLAKTKNGGFALLSMTVFDSIYQKNKSYFTKILKSYTAQ